MWDDDIDFMVGKKQPPKVGRRAGQSQQNVNDTETEGKLESESDRKPSAPIQLRKSGGWADEGIKSAKGRSNSNLIEEERFRSNKKSDSDDDDVPVIPDIEELQDEIYSMEDAQAPALSVNRTTYKELDSELIHLQSNQNAFGKLTDLDLNLLTSKLLPEKEVQDPDVVWTMETLGEKVFSLNPSS